MTLRIIITGGTFDKQYDAIRGQLTFKDTHLPDIIEQVRTSFPIAFELNQLAKDATALYVPMDDDIVAACLVARDGQVTRS